MLVFSPFLNVNNYGLLIGLILKNDYAILAHPELPTQLNIVNLYEFFYYKGLNDEFPFYSNRFTWLKNCH